MARHEKSSDVLLKSPWWVSVVLALVVFVGMRWIAPAVIGDTQIGRGIGMAVAKMAPWPAVFFLMLAAGSALFAAKNRKLVDGQTSLESLRNVSWKHFEWMVGEAYRRMGYAVEETLGGGADGGIDLVLSKDSATTLVQCKQWKAFSVGAPVIREMFGLLTHHQAAHAIVITSGHFTREAEAFAAGKPIDLIDGPKLLTLVQGVQSTSPHRMAPAPEARPIALACPKCGSAMVVRTAKRGSNAGNSFWGCSTYPTCTGTREITT
jgi:restriction system protein